jgi:TPP-dependent trihydroxycyclohexane-1,2-dione (THcHDO) dehydratase
MTERRGEKKLPKGIEKIRGNHPPLIIAKNGEEYNGAGEKLRALQKIAISVNNLFSYITKC